MDLKANFCIPKEYQEAIFLDFLKKDKLKQFNNQNYTILPGFCDVHVHFREPGFSYKETIFTGAKAAAHGGYSAVCTMPNLKPVPDSYENLKIQLDIINRDSCINIYPYGSISVDEKGKNLSNMEELKPYVCAFSDDGCGLQETSLMKEAMEKAKELDMLIVAHCEDNSLLKGGYIHDGEYARKHNHLGICSKSEYIQIERDCNLAKVTGAKYHVCHISTKESVDIIRNAKKDGINVTCETAPHYLILDESFLQEDGKWKMNPPLRSSEDREALIEGIIDGTIDMIATDHAPHSIEEKSKGLKSSPFGIVGIENSFQVLYTYLVKTNIISFEKLMELLVVNPRKRFNIPLGKDYSIWDLNVNTIIDSNSFLSKGKITPFDGMKVFGEIETMVVNSNICYFNEK
ncbi:MAG: dihydroorotase [Clostridia bacterium]|nr:dihydroorotase [Clostridia bacterium]